MILTNTGVLKLMQRIKSFITSQLSTKANSVHTHSISEIENLSSQLGGGGYTKSEVDTLLNSKADTSHTHTKSQITDFPTIPSKTSDLTNDSGFITGVAWNDVSNKPTLATVATSGSYNDLNNKPTIPTVNNGTLTIQQNGTTVDTFTANSSTDKTVNIQCVDLSNNQTVGGIKTFSNAPVVGSINLDGKTIDTDDNDNMTFNGHIVDTIEERGNEYIRYSKGIQICWGYIAAGNTVTKNFPKSFSNYPFVLSTSDTTDSGTTETTQRTSQAITVYRNRQYYGSCYLAIGRWK